MVFKIFLNKASSLDTLAQEDAPKRIRPNKRIMDRFNVSHHKLQLSGSKGGFLIKDLSDGGFSAVAVGPEHDAIALGDAFTATLAFRGNSVTVKVKAAWREGDAVGLQFVDTQHQVEVFLQAILTPVKMGATLAKLDASFMKANENVLWFHGDFDSNITIDLGDDRKVVGWSFYDPECLVIWRQDSGLATGARTKPLAAEGHLGGNWLSATQLPGDAVMDEVPDSGKVQFVYDVLQLFDSDYRQQLMTSIEAHIGI